MPLAFFRQNTEGENRRFNVKSKLDQKELKNYTSYSRFIIVNFYEAAYNKFRTKSSVYNKFTLNFTIS